MKYYNLTVSEEHLRLIGNAIEDSNQKIKNKQ